MNGWTAEHLELMRRHYWRIGPTAMQENYFPYRSVLSVAKQAKRLGLRFVDEKRDPANEAREWPVPEHDLMPALLAVTFRKHGWTAEPNARFGVPMIGAAA